MTQPEKIPEKSDLVEYMRTSNRVWYKVTSLPKEFNTDDLNNEKIEIRPGVNGEVITLKKNT